MKHWAETRQVFEWLSALAAEQRRAALATVVRVRGSAYRREGAKMAVAEDGASVGNVSGGCLEGDVREVALQVIANRTPQLRAYCSGADEVHAWDLGVGCEGEVGIYIEPAPTLSMTEDMLLRGAEAFAVCRELPVAPDAINWRRTIVTAANRDGTLGDHALDVAVAEEVRVMLQSNASSRIVELDGRRIFVELFHPPPQLVILSAGNDARPLARMAIDAGFRVVIADHRPALLAPDRFPLDTRLVDCGATDLAQRVTLDDNTYAVVMTHNFADDEQYLRALIPTSVPYIGILGPRQRTDRILRDVHADMSFDDGRVFGPVGLDVGTDGAEQVSLAIIAEILAVRGGRHPASLRDRQAAIYAGPGVTITGTAAVILAAGASTRMGRNKMLLDVDGKPLVRHAVERALVAGLSPVIVVTGHEAERLRDALAGMPCTYAYNAAFTGPTSGSLHRGLDALPADVDSTVIMLADMPFVSAEMLQQIVAAMQTSPAPLAASRYGDVLAPPLFFRRALFPELLAWHGEGCGKQVVLRHQDEAVILDWPADALLDIDTPEDLVAAGSAAMGRQLGGIVK